MNRDAGRFIGWALFASVLAVECAIGYYLSAVVGVIPVDANSRAASAHYVLFSRDPHLGAIGFVWNPLPSFLQLPIMALKPLYEPIASAALSGVATTAIFAATTAMLLYRNGIYFGLSRAWSVALAVLFAANPFMLLYGANGMSESIFACIIVYVVIQFTRWIDSRETHCLVGMGIGLTFAFLTRYEAVPLGAAVAVAVALVVLADKDVRFRTTLRDRIAKTESVWLVVMTPMLFAIALWLLLNATIMGDPLYFYHSQYSNLAQTQTNEVNQEFVRLVGNPRLVFGYVVKKMAAFSVPLVVMIAWRAFKGTLFRLDMLLLAGLLLSVPSLQILMLYQGSSNGFLRFFFYSLPVLAAWFPYEWKTQRKHVKKPRILAFAASLAFAVSAVWVGYILKDPVLAPEEADVLSLDRSATLESGRIAVEIADYLDRNHPNETVLMDTFSAFRVNLTSAHPKRHIITSDYDFHDALADPSGFGVDYVLVPKPEGITRLNALNVEYPELYEKGEAWCELEHDFDGKWRLYRVIR